jgi:hypothetical protein
MQTIIREVFGRLGSLDPVLEEQRMRQDEEEANTELRLALSPTTVTNPLPGGDTPMPDQALGTHEPESERKYFTETRILLLISQPGFLQLDLMAFLLSQRSCGC